MLAWAVSRWGYPGPSLWWKRCLLSTTRRVMHRMSPEELAMLATSAARLGGAPQRSHGDKSSWAWSLKSQWGLIRATALSAAHASPQALAGTVLAMAQMGLQPGRAWASAVLQASQAKMGAFSAQGLAQLAEGLALMRILPPAVWHARWQLAVDVQDACMAAVHRRAIARTTASFRKLQSAMSADGRDGAARC